MRTLKSRIIILLLAVILSQANFGAATGKTIIKIFKVDYLRQGAYLNIKVTTDLPNNTPLSIGCTQAGIKDTDRWIGCDDQKVKVQNGKAEAILNIDGLPKGQYILEITFNSLWLSTVNKDPKVQSVVGEYGENIKTPYLTTWDKKYRMINYKKAAFKITDHDVKRYDENIKKKQAKSSEEWEAYKKQNREKIKTSSDEKTEQAHSTTESSSLCYELGVRYGRCGAMSFKGKRCDPEDDIVMPERCRGKDETYRGIRDGGKSVR